MALPYAPEGYYRAPQSNISELIMRQGDIAARRAEQNARIWGGAIQDIGNVAGQAITQHAEQKAISKRDAAWTDYVSSGEWQADPKRAYAYSVKIWGPHEGPKQFQALQDVQKIGHGDPAADQAALGNVAARLDKMDEAGIARAWPLVTPLFKKVYGRDLPAQYTPELRPQIKDFITLYGPEAKKRETAVVKGALVDTQTGESIYEAPPEVKEPPKRSLFDILNDPNVPEADKQRAIVAEQKASAAGRGPVAPERPERLTVEQELDDPRTTPERRKKLLDNQAALAAARREPSGGKGSDDLSRRIDSAQSMIGRLETLSKKLIISSGPTQKAIGYGREAASKMGWDADYLTYSDLRQSLAAQVAVATQGARPSDADVFRAALPMVPDPKRDNESSAAQKWGAIHDMFENLSPEGKKQIVAVGGGGSGEITVKDPTGKSHSFATQAEADQFKQAIRIP